MPYTFIDACPLCKVEGSRVDFNSEEGYSATLLEEGSRGGVTDIRCSSCGERLDDFEEVVAACIDEVELERDE